MAASKIHLFKKSAIEAGNPDDYYLDPSIMLIRMESEWSAVEDEDFITVTINHAGFGDQVFVTEKGNCIDIEVAKENKEKAARFGIKAGKDNLYIGLNYNFVSSKCLLEIAENSTKVLIPKDTAHTGEFLMAASGIHLFKKSAIEAGAPDKYYMDPSENLFKIASDWRVVEHDDYLSLLIKLLRIGDLMMVDFEGRFICIGVMKENRERGAARLADENDPMNQFTIELNPKYLKPEGIAESAQNLGDGGLMLTIPKLSPFEIHLVKKSAIEAGKPDNNYLKLSEKLMEMTSEWSVAEDEDFLTLTINHAGFGDQVSVTAKEDCINIEVAKENKETAAGMKNLKIEMNHDLLSSQTLLCIGKSSTKVLIPKDKAHTGEFKVDGVTITC